MILSDFECPFHGVFEALADADVDMMPCPRPTMMSEVDQGAPCGIESPWVPSPTFGRVELVSAVRGKWQPPPTPQHTNTRPLMEGQKMSEWKAERKAMWREFDRKQRKERL